MKLAIVIPTYNEAETIASLIKELFDNLKQLVEKLDILIRTLNGKITPLRSGTSLAT